MKRVDVSLLIGSLASVVFAGLTCIHGIPALRHDWFWPSQPDQIHSYLIDAWSGWDPHGIGQPAPYPSSYLIAPVLDFGLFVFGPLVALLLFLSGIAGLIVFGARACARNFGLKDAAAEGALMLVALFNPWVFSKLVAGHLAMLLAYGAVFGIIAELKGEKSRYTVLALLSFASFAQLQYFLVVVALLLAFVARSEARKALLFSLMVAIPSVLGILFERGFLHTVPYNLYWQRIQSIEPGMAVVLSGYAAGYTSDLQQFYSLAMWFVVIAAGFGVVAAIRAGGRTRAVGTITLALTVGVELISTGLLGPLNAPYGYAVTHVRATAVFRELYDVLGLAAIGYIILAALGDRWAGLSKWPLIGAAGLLVMLWIVKPPSSYFVNAAAIPTTEINGPAQTRFALVPAFQPLKFNGAGSGIDPDYFVRSGFRSPINTLSYVYPSTPALMEYELTGSTVLLGACSVSTIISRPWLQSDLGTLSVQLGQRLRASNAISSSERHIAYRPIFELIHAPSVSPVALRIEEDSIFFEDARNERYGDELEYPQFEIPSAEAETVDPTVGWVDASYTYLTHPFAAQNLGGVATTSSRALAIPMSAVLTYVAGTLVDGDIPVARDTHRYVWVHVKNGFVRCFGFCVVAGEASEIPKAPAVVRHSFAERALAFNEVLPWLSFVRVPASSKDVALRFVASYDPWWSAFSGATEFKHIRLDATINAWIVPGSSQPRSIIVVERLAALQAIFEIVGFIFASYVFIGALARERFFPES